MAALNTVQPDFRAGMKCRRKKRAPTLRVNKISKSMVLVGTVVAMVVSEMDCLFRYFITPDIHVGGPLRFSLKFLSVKGSPPLLHHYAMKKTGWEGVV